MAFLQYQVSCSARIVLVLPFVNRGLVPRRILDALGDDGVIFPMLEVFGIKVLFTL